MTIRSQAQVFVTVAAALLFVSGPCVERARADVGITGTAGVPGQDGHVEYDIRATKSGQGKFKVTVKLRAKPGELKTPDKKFFICMMFQLGKKCGDPERERTTKRENQKRTTLKTVACKIPNPAPRGDNWKPIIDAECWCCEKAPVDVPERQAYHLGCREVDLTPTPDSKGGWHKIFDAEEVEFKFKDPACGLEESDIESFYWDTFLEEHSTPSDKLPRRWVKDCSGTHTADKPDPTADPKDCCPDVKGQDSSMGPEGTIARMGGVAGVTGVNIWAGAFRSMESLGEGVCIISRGQKVRDLNKPAPPRTRPRRISMAAPRPIHEIEERGALCDGKSAFCWLGTAPLDNFWTMNWHGEYPARLHGTFLGPPDAKVTLLIPGQVTHEYEADKSGQAVIDDSYIIGRDSMRWEKDMQLLVMTEPRAGIGPAIRFDGDVIAEPGNPVWEPGTVMHKVSFSPNPDDLSAEETAQPKAVPPEQRLPEGAIFASASVEPDTTIEVQQPGYALVATAEVVTARRVNPGDRLDPNTTPSIQFDDGTGVVIDTLKKAAVPLTATVGLVSLLTQDRPQPLPLYNGSATMCIGSDRPFATPAIATGNVNKVPDKTSAVFLNRNGETVGGLYTFNGLQPQEMNNVAIRTLDNTGAVLEEQKVTGSVLDGTPNISLDKPVYKAGQRGHLRIENQENYQKIVELTRFGGGAKLPSEPIQIVELSDVEGLPKEAPFGTTSLTFQTVHAGEAKVAVIMPRSIPPKQVPNPANNEALKKSNAALELWRSQFGN